VIERLVQATGDAARLLVYFAAAVVLLGASAHAFTWLLMRRGGVQWVWGYWNALGAALLVVGTAAMGYGWLVLGLSTTAGSLVSGLGLLLASAGLWMLVPV
jgi:hypothetical protein